MRASLPSVASLVAASLILPAAALSAQNSGTSHPEAIEESITTNPAPTVTAIPVAATPRPALQTRIITEPVAVPTETATVTPPTVRAERTEAAAREARASDMRDPDEGIVISLPYLKNALSEGTMIRARLNQDVSSKTTAAGSHFTARLTAELTHDGKVVIPRGALLTGRITEVRAGTRLGRPASLHLEPDTVTLPDGTSFRMNARVIDLDDPHNSHVNGEGTVIRTQHAKATLGALSLTTGSAAVAGAVIGGGVGAIVGAGVGIGIGTAWWLRRDRSETLEEGTELVFSLDRPLELTPIVAN